ncbi:MAG: PD40 domain-containing protein [Bacteroidetes bacterium]|nr:PD40 domain-containing protein [Bacteroidota bacterium]
MRCVLFIGLLVFSFSFACLGQQFSTVKTTNEKALRAYNEGQQEAARGQNAIALGYFEKAIKEDAQLIDAYLSLADTYDALHNYTSAKKYFVKALELDTLYAPLAFFRLAQAEWELNEFEAAASHLRRYLSSKKTYAETRYKAVKFLASAEFAAYATTHPVPFQPVSLGPGVNSAEDEYFPVITADGETLLFTRNDRKFVGDENFYRSKKVNGIWQNAEPLVGVNTSDNEGAESISPDGTWLLFTACNRTGDGSQGSCDLYWSQEKGGVWSKPVPFSSSINSSTWDSQPSISADGKSIIFSSRRPGGLGREDLWITHRMPNGKWTKPRNLGAPINTPGAELTPFFHPDGRTLYFSSDSLPGMGRMDLYMTQLQADSSWSKPVNLGYPINTGKDEIALFVSLDGKTAYFSTDRPGGQKLDIYSFELPEAVRPLPVTYARVTVRDQNGQLLAAKLDILDLKSGNNLVSVSTRSDGSALACLPSGKDYALRVSKQGYFFYSENFNLNDTASFLKPLLLDVRMQALPDSTASIPAKGQPVVLRNVFFATGSAELAPESTTELDYLAKTLIQMPWLRIQINGHTDQVGSDSDNMVLSEARAKAVYQYLIAKGIVADRLRYKGFGETRPLPDAADDEAGRARNRRTEFEVW